jgi:hypothetical protein
MYCIKKVWIKPLLHYSNHLRQLGGGLVCLIEAFDLTGRAKVKTKKKIRPPSSRLKKKNCDWRSHWKKNPLFCRLELFCGRRHFFAFFCQFQNWKLEHVRNGLLMLLFWDLFVITVECARKKIIFFLSLSFFLCVSVCFFCQSESIYFNGWQLSRAGPARVQMFFLCLEELRRRVATSWRYAGTSTKEKED